MIKATPEGDDPADREAVITRDVDARGMVFDATHTELVRAGLLCHPAGRCRLRDLSARRRKYRYAWKKNAERRTMGMGRTSQRSYYPSRVVATQLLDE